MNTNFELSLLSNNYKLMTTHEYLEFLNTNFPFAYNVNNLTIEFNKILHSQKKEMLIHIQENIEEIKKISLTLAENLDNAYEVLADKPMYVISGIFSKFYYAKKEILKFRFLYYLFFPSNTKSALNSILFKECPLFIETEIQFKKKYLDPCHFI